MLIVGQPPSHQVYVQLDLREAFDVERVVRRAKDMVEMASEAGLPRDKLVIKVPG
jgi:DNA-binding phage protein